MYYCLNGSIHTRMSSGPIEVAPRPLPRLDPANVLVTLAGVDSAVQIDMATRTATLPFRPEYLDNLAGWLETNGVARDFGVEVHLHDPAVDRPTTARLMRLTKAGVARVVIVVSR